ncbi:hypothetical protein TWF481_005669 [Arthrobotrys musiformis]|uniref:Uncharacterized protein n=1 Tax=Arthrobotrys musiformis TaxID=47236 RepID=A0AAV9WGF8_9PEZI
MKFSIILAGAISGLSLISGVAAGKGKAAVKACVFLPVEPSKPFQVTWNAGLSTDSCMKKRGSGGKMTVSKQGITCYGIGEVEVDDDGTCYWKSSRWGISYNADTKPYSGSTNSRWTTGPANSDITLKDKNPGTSVCGSEAACTGDFVEWNNNKNEAIYIIFRPGAVAVNTVTDEEIWDNEAEEWTSFRTQDRNPWH